MSTTTEPAGEQQGDAPTPEPIRSDDQTSTRQEGPQRERSQSAPGAIYIVFVALLAMAVVATWRLARPSGALDPAAAEMTAAMASTDTNETIAHLRKALTKNPVHYGATYQLARALDRAGKADEARAQWERVLRLAELYDDKSVLEAARTRLGTAPKASEPKPSGDPMTRGLDALYTKHDPAAAIAFFRDVLAQAPEHYGAAYQLATALDQAGRPAEAKPVWEKVLSMAEAQHDTATAERAKARLAPAPVPAADGASDPMLLGLDALYTKRDPATAIARFREVLAKSPDHYGATYQLATALDQAGKAAEARALWTKTLKLAEANKDTKTMEVARARLAKQP